MKPNVIVVLLSTVVLSGLGISSFASRTDRGGARNTVNEDMKSMSKSNDPANLADEKDRGPRNRWFSRTSLKTENGRRVEHNLVQLNQPVINSKRLKTIAEQFGYAETDVSARAWTVTILTIAEKGDSLEVEVQVNPTLIVKRRPAALVAGVMVEKWSIRKRDNADEWQCVASDISKCGLAIE